MIRNRYMVSALDNETGEDVEIIVSASSEKSAIKEATKRTSGMINMKIKKVEIGEGI